MFWAAMNVPNSNKGDICICLHIKLIFLDRLDGTVLMGHGYTYIGSVIKVATSQQNTQDLQYVLFFDLIILHMDLQDYSHQQCHSLEKLLRSLNLIKSH